MALCAEGDGGIESTDLGTKVERKACVEKEEMRAYVCVCTKQCQGTPGSSEGDYLSLVA